MQFFVDKYKLAITIDKSISAHNNLKTLLNESIKLGISICIMVDEYDNFINNLLMHSTDDYQKLVSSKDEARLTP